MNRCSPTSRARSRGLSWGLLRIQNSGPRPASFTSSTNSLMMVMFTTPLEPLLTKCQEILEVDQEILLRALDTLGADKKIIRES